MTQGPMPNGSGLGWVDHAARIVTTVGFPVVAAGLLLWFVLSRFATDVSVVVTQLNTNANAIQQLATIEAKELEELHRQTAALERIERHHERGAGKSGE